MKRITDYRIQEYLNEYNMAFYVIMDTLFTDKKEMKFRVIPKIDLREHFPNLDKLDIESEDIQNFVHDNLADTVKGCLHVSFNRQSKSLTTIILGNPLFSEVLYIDEPEKSDLAKIETIIKNVEKANGVEIGENVTFIPHMIGMLQRKNRE